MTDPASPVPPTRATGGLTYRLRQLQLVLALLFLTMIGLQVFFAGLGVLVSPNYFAWHVSLGHLFALPIFGLFLLGLLGRSGWTNVGLSVALFFLYGLQYAFLEGSEGPVRAFHALNALVLFWLALSLARVSWRNVRAMTPARNSQSPSFGWSLAGGVLVVLGAVVLFGVIFDNGPGLFGPVTRSVTGEETPSDSLPSEPGEERASGTSAPALSGSLYSENCSGCHGAAGEGGFGPALAGNSDLGEASQVVARVLGGGGGMPAFARLSDEDVAAVVSYVRSSWGNGLPSVMPDEVAEQR